MVSCHCRLHVDQGPICGTGLSFFSNWPTRPMGDGKRAESILFSYVGYARDTVSVKDFCQGQTIVMHGKSVMIKETKIRTPRVSQRGGTLTYLVNSLKQKQDRSIADIIQKMPGLQVGEDGIVTY